MFASYSIKSSISENSSSEVFRFGISVTPEENE